MRSGSKYYANICEYRRGKKVKCRVQNIEYRAHTMCHIVQVLLLKKKKNEKNSTESRIQVQIQIDIKGKLKRRIRRTNLLEVNVIDFSVIDKLLY